MHTSRSDLTRRVDERIRAWRVTVDHVTETETSMLAFGSRGSEPVVLKVIRRRGDEWRSGQVLESFQGRGVVRALEHAGGAVLLERLRPGHSLGGLPSDVSDERIIATLADVVARMSPGPPPPSAPTVDAWGEGFKRYAARGIELISNRLVETAHRIYSELCVSQSATRLLHGDLHHHNVLYDGQRGWLAIDPKGVVGELAYEVGAALRNPAERPGLFTAPATIQRRAEYFGRVLRLDIMRILGWAFSQAVLAAIWEVEDRGVLDAGTGWIALANAIQPMLEVRRG